MTRATTKRTLLLAIASIAAIAAAFLAAEDGRAQAGPVAGMWTAERSVWKVRGEGTATIVQLGLRRRGGGRGSWNSSFAVPLSELRGLSSPEVEAPSAEVHFELARDAGTVRFEGRFVDGAGAGHFTFTPSAEFAAEMRARGWGSLDAEKLFSLAVHDVSRPFLRELSALGYDRLTLDQAVSLRIHGATPEFVRELRALGYAGLTVDQLVSFRIHGATTPFIRDLAALGYVRPSPDQLVSMRIHGVSPEFIRELKTLGYEALPVDQLVSMRIHGVTPEFVKRVNAKGPAPVTVDRLVNMRIHGREP
jgi:hypothetical protein